ncbi:MAG TPA: PASTA domain-containing protein [Bacillus bacterium]|nr:PASTA domain-containing protein [Bacillus sp. (in: firmicutes)]
MDKGKTVHIKIGARILSLLFVLLFFILTGRFVYLQTVKEVDGHNLSVLAEKKWGKERTIEASRGQILDRNGEVIAKDVPTYTLYAVISDKYSKNAVEPQHVIDKHETAEKLAPLLNMQASEIERRLNPAKPNTVQVELGPKGKNIDHQLMEKIKELNLPGIFFSREKKRLYPNGIFASHVIGFAQADDDGKIVGMMGVEKTFDDILHGKDGLLTFQSDRRGLKLPDPKEMIQEPENGKDIYLTLDQKIQTFLENALTYADKEYEPENIIGIVANAKTGEILAMGTRPSFDPNTREISNYMNEVISSRFEPGSTMKVFTLAAAIDAGAFNANETYMSGSYQISKKDKAIRDHNKSGWGTITYLEGVQRSSNVAFAKLVNEKLGTDKFLEYLQRFHFDKITGIDLPNEVPGNILFRYPIEKITTAYGQGTAVTPIQQIQAATAISNGGKMMKPYIIKKIVDPKTGEVIKQQEPTVVNEPIKEKTAKQVLDILETVVSSEAGTGKPYRIEGYKIAGKTGTAQIPDPKTGKYMTGNGNNIFSFIGFAPKDDPQLIMYVSVKRPKLEATELGSAPAAYVFKNVMKNSLHYMNIMPSEKNNNKKPVAKTGIELPNVIGQEITKANKDLSVLGLKVIPLGKSGNVIAQNPIANDKVLPSEKVLVKTEGELTMPDISGWALRDVTKLTELLNLKLNVIGKGYVTKQNIQPGSKVKRDDYLVVELSPPFQENVPTIEIEEKLQIKNKEDKEIFELLNSVRD